MRAGLLTFGMLIGLGAWAAEDGQALMHHFDEVHRLKVERTENLLVLQDAGGAETSLAFEVVAERGSDGTRRSRIRFTSPAEVRGTTLLNIASERGGDDQQWLYLPAFRKTRRVGGAEDGDRFVGSDLFFEDVKYRRVDDWHFKVLRSEAFAGNDCWLLEGVPADPQFAKESPYGKVNVWLRKDNYVPVRSRYFDRQMQPLKELQWLSYSHVEGTTAWRPDKGTMVDIQRKHRTIITTTSRQVNVQLPRDTFSPNAIATQP